MKSYTDIEQSRKLAEILPVESADMYYARIEDDDEMRDWTVYLSPMPKICATYVENLPCWSLAALLEQLDDEIIDEDGNDYNLSIVKEGLQYQLFYHDSWGQVEDIESNFYDDMVDACVEIILKLKEKDLL